MKVYLTPVNASLYAEGTDKQEFIDSCWEQYPKVCNRQFMQDKIRVVYIQDRKLYALPGKGRTPGLFYGYAYEVIGNGLNTDRNPNWEISGTGDVEFYHFAAAITCITGKLQSVYYLLWQDGSYYIDGEEECFTPGTDDLYNMFSVIANLCQKKNNTVEAPMDFYIIADDRRILETFELWKNNEE